MCALQFLSWRIDQKIFGGWGGVWMLAGGWGEGGMLMKG